MSGETFLKLCLILGALHSPPMSAEQWTASVVRELEALVRSCVVVPCSFSHPKEPLPSSRLRAKWHRSAERDQLIYYEDKTQVLENFRGRTRILGDMGKGNCSLEITQIKEHDNGPFCFRIELARTETDTKTKDMFSFVEDCVTLRMMPEPKAPSLTHNSPIEGVAFTITCSVTHTCPTDRPNITWSRGSAEAVTETHTELVRGLWEVRSILAFLPAASDDHQEVTCTALFNGGRTSMSRTTLYVKRSANYNHIIVPVAVALGSAAIFGGLCILMVKKYKRRIAELQREDGTLFNRLSRLSRRMRSPRRIPSGQRQDTLPKNCNEAVSKPRFPSPKSKPRVCSYPEDDADDYMNTAELNVYGNL